MKKVYLTLLIIGFYYVAQCQQIPVTVEMEKAKAVTQMQMIQATVISDINQGFPSGWIDEIDYIKTYVQIKDTHIAYGKNHNLSEAQQELLRQAKVNDPVNIKVEYFQENAVTSQREIKTIEFNTIVLPFREAQFKHKLSFTELLEHKLILAQNEYDLTIPESVKLSFAINTKGNVEAINFLESVDANFKETLTLMIKGLPRWIPAKDKDGAKINQLFKLNIGSSIGC